MALATGTVFQISASATTANINGSGFNPVNAHFPADLAGTSANTASPVVTSATYTFVSGDVGNWVYIKSGSNWTVGWYQIASVATGAATLSAGIGQAVQQDTYGNFKANTIAGCATTASPSSGTYGVDYSQTNTANSSISNAASVASSVTMTSASNPWTPVSVGNFFHLTGAGTNGLVGWYEIVTYVSAGNVTTDRTTNNGTGMSGATGQTGGAGNLNALEDSYQAMLPTGAYVWMQNGSYTLSAAISTASSNGTTTSAILWQGFNVYRGDVCNGTNRPLIIAGANAVTFSQNHLFRNFSFTTTAANGIAFVIRIPPRNCKFVNTSTTAGRYACGGSGANSFILASCELVSQNGTGATISGQFLAYGCYIHDSFTGVNSSSTVQKFFNNVFASCVTTAVVTGTRSTLIGNTFYGAENTLGIGLDLSTANSSIVYVINNIFYGLATGVTNTTGSATNNIDYNNDYYNNTTDVTFWDKDVTDLALAPQFINVSQLLGTTATTSGSVLTDNSQNFNGVTDNVDYVYVSAGTGVTTGIYLITSHTSTTITTNNALGTGTSVSYQITIGHNFGIGTNLRNLGLSIFGGETTFTNYLDIGGVQRANLLETSSVFSG